MTGVEIVLVILCFVLVILPNSYDPAIRMKEWLEKKRKERE